MGLFGSLFGGGRSKTDLIRDLVKLRISSDPMAHAAGLTPDAVDSLSKMRLNMLPEAGIVANVGTYLTMKKMGADDSEIFDRIEQHRSRLVSGYMPDNCDLRSYIKYRAHLENSSGLEISDESIDFAIDQAIEFLKQ